jgi:hypothetical protein
VNALEIQNVKFAWESDGSRHLLLWFLLPEKVTLDRDVGSPQEK